ncbi:MAG: hypothetical protein ACPGF7_08915 [Pontibacterium sp.]
MKSLIGQVDLWLGRIVTAFMLPILYLCFAALSAFMLFVIGIGIFEYEIGLSDLDRLEFLLISLVLLTSYRLFYRGRKLGWSFWCLIKRFCFVTAVVILIDFFIFGLVVTIMLYEKGKVMAGTLYQYQDAQFLVLGGVLVLALYAAAPLPSLFRPKSALEDSEPKAEDEVSNEKVGNIADEIVDPWSVQSGSQKG